MKSLKTYLFYIFFLISFMFIISPIETFAIEYESYDIEVDEDGRISVEGMSKLRDEESIKKNREQQDALMAEKYKHWAIFIDFVSGMAAITTCGIFIKHCIKFASLGGEHWIVRRNSMIGMLWSGIATVLLGGVTLIVAILFNLFA